MKIINLNNWALINNSASVSLPHLHAKFDILTKDDELLFHLTINDSDMKTIELDFNTLEDVTEFTEDVVRKCWTNEEVYNKYCEMFENNRKKLTRRNIGR